MSGNRFEEKLLTMLEEVDARTPREARAAAVSMAVPTHRSRRLVVVAATAASVTACAAAVAVGVAVLTGPPSFQASSDVVEAGHGVIAKGSGCGASVPVAVSLGDTALDPITASDDGTFIADVPVPSGTQPGDHTVTARCSDPNGNDLVQQLSLRVYDSLPPMEPSFAAGGDVPRGGTAYVKGSGCKKGVVWLEMDGTVVKKAAATQDGAFLGDFVVPESTTIGDHRMTASCTGLDGSPLEQHATLRVVASLPEPAPSKS